MAILGAVIAVSAWYVCTHPGEFGRIGHVGFPAVVGMGFLALLSFSAAAVVVRMAASRLGAQVGLGEGFWLLVATRFTNLLPMKAGLAAQAIYLKGRHGLPLARFASMAAFSHLLQFFLVGAIGTAVAAWASATGGNRWYRHLLFIHADQPLRRVECVCLGGAAGAALLPVVRVPPAFGLSAHRHFAGEES